MNPMVEIKIRDRGIIKIELYPKSAPNSVNSFVYLIENNIFNGKLVKRVVQDFVIQPSYSNFDCEFADYNIEGEYKTNGFKDGYKLEKGSVSLGGDGISVSSGSSFFIVMGPLAERLIDKFPCIGKVVEGFDILEDIQIVKTIKKNVGIENVEVNEPILPEIIETITVNTYGIKYEKPIKIQS